MATFSTHIALGDGSVSDNSAVSVTCADLAARTGPLVLFDGQSLTITGVMPAGDEGIDVLLVNGTKTVAEQWFSSGSDWKLSLDSSALSQGTNELTVFSKIGNVRKRLARFELLLTDKVPFAVSLGSAKDNSIPLSVTSGNSITAKDYIVKVDDVVVAASFDAAGNKVDPYVKTVNALVLSYGV